jgi:formylglycine-generating enzyme required for sulfatase activity
VDGIGLGENWRKRLQIALGEARFFIPILTPNYFESQACRDELETFLQFEAESRRDDLILPRPGTVFRDIHAVWCPELVVIPPGEFMMGSTEAEREWTVAQGAEREFVDSETPQHLVRISRLLAVGQYPVTFEQYDQFCDETGRNRPRDQGWGRGRLPVMDMSWDDAKAYIDWLAAQTRRPYRLLSEAEWEYACRAGNNPRRVVRGGSWNSHPMVLRVANRFKFITDYSYDYIGFRIARTLSS